MTTSEAYHKMVLYFYLATLNEKQSTENAIKASKLFQIRQKEEKNKFDAEIAVVQICTSIFGETFTENKEKQFAIMNASVLSWPDHLDLTPWREFQKRSSVQERLTVLWVNVLEIEVTKLATALNLTEGTIRYRLGKGLSLLGQLNRPNWGVV